MAKIYCLLLLTCLILLTTAAQPQIRPGHRPGTELTRSPRRETPPFLFFNYRSMNISSAAPVLGELKLSVSSNLRDMGFTDVVLTETEVAGNRNGVRVAVLHLPIGGRSYWEVVTGAGHVRFVTQRTVNEVMDMLIKLKFL